MAKQNNFKASEKTINKEHRTINTKSNAHVI